MAPAARLRDVSHVYGGRPVLRRLDLELETGKAYLLLGPNGAGKTTLLRILAGLLRPSFGSVLLWGQPAEAVRGRIGYMSHAPMLYAELTGEENLRYFAAIHAPRVAQEPEAAMRAVGLGSALGSPVWAYSQGMRQRLSLARALLARPELLLLDEPFSNMDAPSAEAMLSLLAAERARGAAVVLTTHQRALAAPLADELLLLDGAALTRA